MSAFALFRPLGRSTVLAPVLAFWLLSALSTVAVVDDASGGWGWPLTPRPVVVAAFDPPDSPYGAGNRGVDLAGSVGQPVLSIGDGVVTYAGVLAGRGVVVVNHGPTRSTYEPVSAGVAVGDVVHKGQPIGVLAAVGSHCPPATCLHLGVIRGSGYVDPLPLLSDPPVRLKPLAGEPAPLADLASAAHDAAVAAAGYRWPVVR